MAATRRKYFVSYDQADQAWAEWVAWHIEDMGYEVRIKSWDFGPGSNLVNEVDEAARWADVTVAVVSPDYLESEFGKAEWMAAFASDPTGVRRQLLPIRVRSCSFEGLWLSVNYIDLVGLDESTAQIQLTRGIVRGRQKPGHRPPFPPDVAGPSDEPRFPAPPTPYVPNDLRVFLANQLKDAHDELRRRALEKRPDHDVRKQIIDIKRQLREGGRLRKGDLLGEGRYELLEPLGEGGFAYVWRSWDTKKNKTVAIKVLYSRHAGDRSRIERFERGARKMRQLSHPGIVQVLDEPLEDQGYHFFVMEYLSGGDFRNAVLKGILSTEEIWRTILAIGEALAYAHNEGIIHRDIKPSNILLDDQLRTKLTDFDLVQAGDTTGGTRTGALGTFIYAAPEMMERPQAATQVADVYGLGMTSIFAIYGQDLTFEAFRDSGHFLDRIDEKEEVKQILAQAVEWNEKDRWDSITSFCSALEEALSLDSDQAGLTIELQEVVDSGLVDPQLPSSGGGQIPSSGRGKERDFSFADEKELDRQITHLVNRLSPRSLAAEDRWEVHQESLMRLWEESRSRLDLPKPLGKKILSDTVKEAIARKKKELKNIEKRQVSLEDLGSQSVDFVDDSLSLEATLERGEFRQKLERVLRELRPPQRQAMILLLLGYGQKEIAIELGLDSSAAKSLLASGRKKLRQELGGYPEQLGQRASLAAKALIDRQHARGDEDS